MESLICNFYLSVAARKIVEQIRPRGTLECCWDIKQRTNNNNFTIGDITAAAAASGMMTAMLMTTIL